MRLSELPAGWTAEVVRTGMSGASVERWTKPGEPHQYRKFAPTTWDRGLAGEAARLQWLATTPFADRVAVVVAHELDQAEGIECLVTTAVPGVDGVALAEECDENTDESADLARRFGAALRTLHETLDPRSCSFDARLDLRLAAAGRRVREGHVDVDEFEPENTGRTPKSVLEELHATRPPDEDLVVVHGDWCYPNVLFDGHGGWWMVDLADLGVACRWYDLGIGARSTSHNLGDAAVAAFFEGYGIEPDEERVRYYVLLDELQ